MPFPGAELGQSWIGNITLEQKPRTSSDYGARREELLLGGGKPHGGGHMAGLYTLCERWSERTPLVTFTGVARGFADLFADSQIIAKSLFCVEAQRNLRIWNGGNLTFDGESSRLRNRWEL